MRDINILIIEDEEKIREIIRTYMVKEQYHFYEAESGDEAFLLFDQREYQMILLDVMLPDTDGWTILRKIRQESKVPIIMLTARGEEDDKLLGFDLGVDDYVTKPFSVKELMARIKTILKRNHTVTSGELMTIGKLSINMSFHQIKIDGKDIELTPLEYKLLMYFIDNRNMALDREQILNGVWGYDYYGDERTVDTHVKRLRKKLLSEGPRIITIRGLGYRMVVEE